MVLGWAVSWFGLICVMVGNGVLVKEHGLKLPYLQVTIGYEMSWSLMNYGEDLLLLGLMIVIGMHFYKLRTTRG